MFDDQTGRAVLSFVCIFVSAVVASSLATEWTSASAAPQTPGIELGPDRTQQASTGQTLVYHHILTNTGTTTDTFWLEVLSTQDWPVELLGGAYPTGTLGTLVLPQIGAQMTIPVQVSLTVPLSTAGVTEITIITATSQLSPTVHDTATDTTIVSCKIYLPLVLKRWPPIPYRPILNPISNSDGDGNYTVSWTEQPVRLAETYTLQEATDAAFTTDLRIVCTTSQQSCAVSNKPAGTYYYRVQGRNTWDYSDWSLAQSVTVLLPATPNLNPIGNADGDGSYNVTWNAAARAANYVLQQDTNASFNSPTTVYNGAQTSWAASGNIAGTYYYRVRAHGPTGVSAWSNVRATTVQASVYVVSSNAFVPYSGSNSLYIVGEVHNATNSNAEFIQISATLRDGNGNVVASDYSYSDIYILTPGMTSPFLVLFYDAPTWASYDLVVTWSTTDNVPYPLKILNQSTRFDSYDAFHVTGEIRNQYGEQRTFVKAFVTLYDENHNVVGTDYAYTNPYDLNPGQTASFDVEIYFYKDKPDHTVIDSYLLQVYDD
jgi:hypothetical protein